MKAKTTPQTPRQKIIMWLLLFAAYGLVLIGMPCRRYINAIALDLYILTAKTDHWIFYYFPGLIYTAGVAVAALWLCAIAAQKGLSKRVAFFSGVLLTVIIAGFALFSPNTEMDQPIYVNSVSLGEHRYHLIRYDYYATWNRRAYIVMECDPTGLKCHYYTMASRCLKNDATLDVDSVRETLLLRRDYDPIEIDLENPDYDAMTSVGCESR